MLFQRFECSIALIRLVFSLSEGSLLTTTGTVALMYLFALTVRCLCFELCMMDPPCAR
jgi:hypothetical protein